MRLFAFRSFSVLILFLIAVSACDRHRTAVPAFDGGHSKRKLSAPKYRSHESGGDLVSPSEGKRLEMKSYSYSWDSHAEAAPEEALAPLPGSGLLTAGELNDFSKWELWTDFSSEELKQHQDLWKIKPFARYTAELVNEEGKPLTDLPVVLKDERDNIIWSTRTDNTGKAELWSSLFLQEHAQSFTLEAVYEGRTYQKKSITDIRGGINRIRIAASCHTPAMADVLFVVDATGSMGDEILFLKEELNDIIRKVKDRHKTLSLNVGSVFYRDHGDEYVTKQTGLSADVQQTISFIKDQEAGGGGDFPEAVSEALDVAINDMSWSPDARARLLFLVLDAPPHEQPEVVEKLQKNIARAAEKGIRIIPVTASGIDKSTEYIMRSMALATNGTYVFLTDHSGIGNSHIEPTTDEYDVELLNDLMVRLFDQFLYSPCDRSELASGQPRDTSYVYNPRIIAHVKLNTWPVKKQLENVLPGRDTENSDSVTVKDTVRSPELTDDMLNQDFYSFRYYPNPTQGRLFIEVDGKVKELCLTDINGKLLKVIPVSETGKTETDLSEFPSGMYFLKYAMGERLVSGKLMLFR